MVITDCKLPPKAGYVEDEIDGERVYVETPEHREQRLKEEEISNLKLYCDKLLIQEIS